MTEEEMQDYFPTVYPKMFSGKYGGIAVGKGWFGILTQLCQSIQSHIDWKNRDSEVIPQVVVEQVKEKFGSLRFYYQGGDDYIHGLTSMAESMSGITCEECGAPGETGGNGWITTLCETHRLEREKKRAEYMKQNGLEE
jgi:hypothetical protein